MFVGILEITASFDFFNEEALIAAAFSAQKALGVCHDCDELLALKVYCGEAVFAGYGHCRLMFFHCVFHHKNNPAVVWDDCGAVGSKPWTIPQLVSPALAESSGVSPAYPA